MCSVLIVSAMATWPWPQHCLERSILTWSQEATPTGHTASLPHPNYTYTYGCPGQWQMKRVLAGVTDAMRLDEACYFQTLKKAGGGAGGKGVCVCVCVCIVRAHWVEENLNSILWFSWHILPLPFQSPGLMGTTESRANDWTSFQFNLLLQSPSFHEFPAFILPFGWGCYWDMKWERPGRERKWVSRKLRVACVLFWNVPLYFSEGFSTGVLSWHKSNKSLSTGPVFDKMPKTNKQTNK